MPPTLFTKVDYTLASLLQQIEEGVIGLPDIQRPFVWANTKVRDLFDSMYNGYPVGYLLFWANGLEAAHRAIGSDPKQRAARLLIVDGQQRLTSLYAVIKGVPVLRESYAAERIILAFRPLDGRFDVTDAAIRKDPTYIPDISVIWSRDVGLFKLTRQYLAGLRATRSISEEDAEQVEGALERLKGMEGYPFTALELNAGVTEEQVAEVFVRINSQGQTLKQADFILTLMSVFWDEGRAALEAFCRAAKLPSTEGASPFNPFIKPSPDQLLRVAVALGFRRARLSIVYSILRGKDLETDKFDERRRVEQFATLQQAQQKVLHLQTWHEFLKALTLAGFRSGEMISSETGLLYSYALYLVGKHAYAVPPKALRQVIAEWFFMVALTSRYTGSFETTAEQDLARVRDARSADEFVAVLQRIIRDTLTDDYWTIQLPNALAVSSGRSPAVFAYHAALALLEANVLFSKMRVTDLLNPMMRAHKSALERHHLFPKAYLARLGIKEQKEVNQAANFALVEWLDNIEISDDAPATYLPRHMAHLSEPERAAHVYWHALPPAWETMPYPIFLTERRKRMAQVTRAGFHKLQSGEAPEPPALLPSPVPETLTEEDRNSLRFTFWAELLERAAGRTPLLMRQSSTQSRYLSASSAFAQMRYYLSILLKDSSAGMTFNLPEREDNRRLLESVLAHKEALGEAVGYPLTGGMEARSHLSWVGIVGLGHGLLDRERWPETQEILIDALIRLDATLRPFLLTVRAEMGLD